MQFHQYNFFLLIISTLAGFSCCQNDEGQDVFGSNKNYCGEHLTTALSKICDGKYNTLQKSGSVFKKASYWDAQYMSDMPYPYQSRAEASSMLNGYKRRKKRGVYNECCQKPCSREELSTYCASPSKRRRR